MDSEKKKKIGFLEKWNEAAKQVEFSVTRLQMVIFTVYTMAFAWKFFIVEEQPIDSSSLMLFSLMLLACFSPKLLKDVIDNQLNIKNHDNKKTD